MKKKKIIPILLTVAMVVSTLAGCSSKSADGGGTDNSNTESNVESNTEDNTEGNTDGDEKITLTIELSQDMKTGNSEAVNEVLYEAFEKEYPNIKIEELLVPDAQVKNVILTKISAGEPSDIIVCNRLNGEADYNSKENMLDLSDMEFVERMKDSSIIEDSDGKVRCYQPKYSHEGSGIVYNKTLFQEYGIEIPTTWDEFLNVCQKLADNGIQPLYGPYKEIWTFQIITTNAFGQLEVFKIPGTADALNSGEKKWSEVPEFEGVLTRAKELVDKGYFGNTYLSDDWASVPNKMTSGEYGMLVGFNTNINDLANSEYEFGFFPLNIIDGIEPCMVQPQVGGCLFIPKDAANADAAKKYIEFISRPENVNLSQSASSFIPTIEGADEPVVEGQQIEFNTEYVETGKVINEFNSYILVDMTKLWSLYQEMLAGQITPAEVLEHWDEEFSRLMNQAGYEGF